MTKELSNIPVKKFQKNNLIKLQPIHPIYEHILSGTSEVQQFIKLLMYQFSLEYISCSQLKQSGNYNYLK